MAVVAVVLGILIALGWLAVGIWRLKYGLREQSWFWALVGGWLIWGVVGPVLALGVFAALMFLPMFLPPEVVLAILFSIVLIIWAMLGCLAFKHKEELVGKGLFFLAVVWSGVLSLPLIGFLRWGIAEALLTPMGISALALVSWGLIMRQARAAKARKEAFYKRMLEDAEPREKPPWEQ